MLLASPLVQANSAGTVKPVALDVEKSSPLLGAVVGFTSKIPVSMYVEAVGRYLMLVPQVADGSRLSPASDTMMRGSPQVVPEINWQLVTRWP